MPHRRGRTHALQRDDAARAVALAVDKRVVTIYTTLASSGWAGGDLTTLSQSSRPTSGAYNPKTASPEEASSDAQGINVRAQDPSLLPTAISAVPEPEDMTALDAPLVAQTAFSSTTSTSTSSTRLAPTSSTATAAAASETAASTKSSSSNGSDDVASKAGIALGVLGGLFLLLAFVYFIIVRRRKKLEAQRVVAADDEKRHSSFDDRSSPASETPVMPPQVSLRPVTELFNFNNASQGVALAISAAPNLATRPTTSNSSNASENPFSNNAQISENGLAPAPAPAPRVSALTMDGASFPPPLSTKDLPRSPPRSIAEVSPIESEASMAVGQTTSASHVSRGTLSVMDRQPSERRQSVRKENVPAPLDLTIFPIIASTVPPSPAGTEFSMAEMDPDQSPYPSAGAASIAADGGPSNTTVHRIQLDFKPTLDDELELQAGQLIRMLHEYDDGWALCIRLDRSQQGVVPRTCLSARPVRPRLPQGSNHRAPPVNAQNNQRGHAGARSMGPPVSLRGPGPMMRAMGPDMETGPRPQSPSSLRHMPGFQKELVETPALTSQSHLPGQAY